MSNSVELRQQRAAIVAQARQLVDKAEGEKRSLNGEENEQWGRMMADVDSLALEVEKLERKERVESLEAECRHSTGRKTSPLSGLVTNRDDRWVAESIRAWSLMGTPYARTDADTLYRAAECGINLHSPTLNIGSIRALSKGTANLGAESVPTDFSTEYDKQLKYYCPIRSFVRVIQTQDGRDFDWPTWSDVANTAQAVDEAGNINVNVDPASDKVTMKAWKIASPIVKVSTELLQDSAVPIEGLLADLLAERMARKDERDFTIGNSTTEPQGINAVSAAVTLTSGGFTFQKLIDLQHSVDLAYRNSPKARFLFNDDSFAAIRKLADSTGQPIFQVDTRSGAPDTILGSPYTVCNSVVPLASGGSNNKVAYYGDFSRYVVRDVAGSLTLTRLNELYAANGQVGFVITSRRDGRYVNTSAVKALQTA